MKEFFRISLKNGTVVAIIAAVALAGCASRETLVAKSAGVPAGVNLSGRWALQAASVDTLDQLHDAEIRAAGGRDSIIRVTKRNRDSRSKGSLVHVFLETAERLKITQTEFTLFVSFGRSIVEEYRFGENRAVNVGPVEAARVSGWEEGTYVIETLDRKHNKLVERYHLENGGNLLIRQISIWKENRLSLAVVQKFDRV